MIYRPRVLAASIVTAILLTGSAAQARPVHKRTLADYLGPFLTKQLNDCRTCHVPDKAGEKPEEGAEKPHNVFGERLKVVRQELLKAEKNADLAHRLDAIADEDTDGDGVANRIEMITGHHPGDPKDKPSADELADVAKKLTAFVKFRGSYPWRPFEPVKRPAVPVIKNAGWVRNPIDHFLAAEHEERGLKPRPEAPKHLLLRRLYLDLIGLPPTREELQTFLADNTPDAYEKVVDQLLADSRYGERWGRHWMDVWRYSDWAGYGQEVRRSQKHIWHWRDWIVESLNADKPYDRMVLEMLAADELAPDDPDALRATGYLVRNWFKFNRNVWLDDTIEHTGKAFLGLTINCARCHDHFFDTITQEEYYQFRAIFEPHNIRTDRLPGQPDINKDGLPRVFDSDLKAVTHLFVRGQEHLPDKNKAITPGVPALLGGQYKIEPVKLPESAYAPDRRDFVLKETMEALEQAVGQALQALEGARKKNAADAAKQAEMELVLAEVRRDAFSAVLNVEAIEDSGRKDKEPELWKKAAENAVALQRRQALLEAQRNQGVAHRATEQAQTAADKANADLAEKKDDKALQAAAQKADAALKAAKTKSDDAEKQLAAARKNSEMPLTAAYTKRAVQTYPTTSSGRRLALARWIVDKNNPLAARVAVNQIWLRHFGRAIVPSVFDFGRNGRLPSHPALLDWLAAEFMEPTNGDSKSAGWSMKHLHRLIVTSAAYRMDSNHDADSASLDSENHYLWRMNPRRMEAELVRDSVLHVAGNLDVAKGGPDIDHNLGLTSRRRSIYFRHAAEKQMVFLDIFDAANVNECYQRTESIVPQQALALANSTLALEQSRLLARKLAREFAESSAFIKAGFEQILNRPPTAQEQAECEKFLSEQTARFADKTKLTAFNTGPACNVPPSPEPSVRARENLIHVLLNHNEFVTIR